MRVLYISNYRDGTGWGNAALNNILALDSAGVTVVPRSITFNGRPAKVPQRILELEDNEVSNIDVCIQHTLPTLYSYQAGCKNIGFYETETYNFENTFWQKYINIMDEAWVPSRFCREASLRSKVTIPVKVVPHCLDIEKYKNFQRGIELDVLDDSFNFCFVGEFSKRKNLPLLIRAFHQEFHPSENVNILYKINSPLLNSDRCVEEFNIMHTNIIKGMKIRQTFKDPVVVAGYLEDNDLYTIMSQCHCFVCPSYGEGWCIPGLEAMALGLQVIYPDNSGLADFANTGFIVETKLTPCFGANDTMDNIYTSFDDWMEPDIYTLMSCMRSASMLKDQFKKEYSIRGAEKFDIKKIGEKMRNLLNE